MSGQLEIANVSDVGRRRPHNEDSTGSDADLGLVVLADGMGGYKAGEVASAIAVVTVMEDVREGLKTLQGDEPDPDTGYSPQSLLIQQAVIKANEGIFNTARQEADCQGMGTTIVVGLFYEDRLTVAHVGDSRMYRLRGDTLEQITRDHSLIQELIARGICTPEEAAATTPKNLVTRALGIESTVEIDILEEQALPGDIYLLCSDGLNDMVDDEEIRLTLRKYSANLVESARELVRLANEKGGRDNISVILVRKPERPAGFNGIYRRLLRFFGQG